MVQTTMDLVDLARERGCPDDHYVPKQTLSERVSAVLQAVMGRPSERVLRWYYGNAQYEEIKVVQRGPQVERQIRSEIDEGSHVRRDPKLYNA